MFVTAPTMTATTSSTLPLTTQFIPPKSCLNEVYEYNFDSVTDGILQYATYSHLGPIDHLECLPSGWGSSTYFSPGLCPSHYSIAHSSMISIGSSTETHATCCPINYTIASAHTPMGQLTGPCVSSSSDDTTILSTTISNPNGEPFAATVTYLPSSIISIVTLANPDLVNAYAVSIRWQSTDFATSTPAVSYQPISTSSTESSGKTHDGFGDEAKIGIGVGVSLGVILVLALALCVLFVRRRRSQRATISHDGHDQMPVEYFQGPAELLAPSKLTFELHGDHTPKAAELHG